MSRSKMTSPTNPRCTTPSSWFAAVQRPLAVLAAVSTIALPAIARGQAPVTLGVGSDSSCPQAQKVLKDVPATPEHFVPADVVPLVVGGVTD